MSKSSRDPGSRSHLLSRVTALACRVNVVLMVQVQCMAILGGFFHARPAAARVYIKSHQNVCGHPHSVRSLPAHGAAGGVAVIGTVSSASASASDTSDAATADAVVVEVGADEGCFLELVPAVDRHDSAAREPTLLCVVAAAGGNAPFAAAASEANVAIDARVLTPPPTLLALEPFDAWVTCPPTLALALAGAASAAAVVPARRAAIARSARSRSARSRAASQRCCQCAPEPPADADAFVAPDDAEDEDNDAEDERIAEAEACVDSGARLSAASSALASRSRASPVARVALAAMPVPHACSPSTDWAAAGEFCVSCSCSCCCRRRRAADDGNGSSCPGSARASRIGVRSTRDTLVVPPLPLLVLPLPLPWTLPLPLTLLPPPPPFSVTTTTSMASSSASHSQCAGARMRRDSVSDGRANDASIPVPAIVPVSVPE